MIVSNICISLAAVCAVGAVVSAVVVARAMERHGTTTAFCSSVCLSSETSKGTERSLGRKRGERARCSTHMLSKSIWTGSLRLLHGEPESCDVASSPNNSLNLTEPVVSHRADVRSAPNALQVKLTMGCRDMSGIANGPS